MNHRSFNFNSSIYECNSLYYDVVFLSVNHLLTLPQKKRYFTCAANYGLMVPIENVQLANDFLTPARFSVAVGLGPSLRNKESLVDGSGYVKVTFVRSLICCSV